MPDARPLRLAIAGGGTGGHVSPALAVVGHLRTRLAAEGRGLELLWLGSEDGVERTAAANAGIPYVTIPTGKLRRYLTWLTVRDAIRVPLGLLAARRHLARFRPHVLFSTGGFVSVPAVVAARLLGIPCLTHEQTVTVGLANRINARFATRIALSYAASAAWLPNHPVVGGWGLGAGGWAAGTRDRVSGIRDQGSGDRGQRAGTGLTSQAPNPQPPTPSPQPPRRAPVVFTGNPVRAELFAGQAERARAAFGFAADLPVVYLTGGARGAHALNEAVAAALPELLTVAQLVHQTGPAEANGDLPRLERLAADLPAPLAGRYAPRAFIGAELPDLYALASLVIGRAGAGTVAELAALGKPALLIPLPGASADEQTRNARLLAEAGAAVLLPESDLTPARLTQEVRTLLADPDRLACMGAAARQFARPDAAERLADHLLALASPTARGPGPN